MCQRCLDNGLITQDEYDRIQAGEDAAAVLSPETQVAVLSGSLDDAPDFIKRLFGESQSRTQTPDEKSQEDMDEAVATVLDWLKGKMDVADAMANVDSPEAMDKLAQAFAGELMFRIPANTITYGLVVFAMRYQGLLDQWADLYVRYAKDLDQDETLLDSATTAESKLAVTKASQEKTEPPTGMYL